MGIDIAVSVEVAGLEDLCVSQISERRGRVALGCAVSVAVVDVDAEDCLLAGDQMQERRKREQLSGEHLVVDLHRARHHYLSNRKKQHH